MSQALFSITLEQDVIGAILESKTAFDAVSGIVNDGDFYDLRHASLFRAVSYLSRQNQSHDALSVSHHLAKHGRLECIGGDAYIGDIVRSTHYAGESSIEARALQVRNLSSGRRLIASCQKIISMVESPTEASTLDDTINQAESLIMSIRDSQARENEMGPKPIKDVLNRTLDILESRVHTNGETGIDTGFDNLNEIIHGLHPKTLVIVAAVPGMGKTTFAINMIENAMLKNGIDGPAVVFSMEMGDTDLAERMISSVGSVYQGNMRTSKMAEDDWKKVSAAVTKMHNWPMYIDETPTMNIMQMRAKLRRISRNHNGKVGVVLVDYLQLMQAVEKTSDRQREVAEIAVGLKSLSKEFNCPVVALSQLSRKVSDRPNKRPMMSDLRESGYIEQAADLIMFIYRDEIYNIDSKDKGLAEIIIGKQRKGKTGVKVVMRFDGGRSRFVDDMQQQDWQS